eukprot:scaffold1153_cov94-Isochrysis_galbana.AAC.1
MELISRQCSGRNRLGRDGPLPPSAEAPPPSSLPVSFPASGPPPVSPAASGSPSVPTPPK